MTTGVTIATDLHAPMVQVTMPTADVGTSVFGFQSTPSTLDPWVQSHPHAKEVVSLMEGRRNTAFLARLDENGREMMSLIYCNQLQ